MTALLLVAAICGCFLCYISGLYRGRNEGWLERYYQQLDSDKKRRASIARNSDGTFSEKGLTK